MSNPVFLPGQSVCPFCLSPRSNEGKVLQFSCGTRIYPTNEVVDRRIPCFRREIEDLRKQAEQVPNLLAVAQTAKNVWLWYSCVAEGGRVDEIEHLGEKLARWEDSFK